MTDIFLRSGHANPNDVSLRDPTTADSGGYAGDASGGFVTVAIATLDGAASGGAAGAGGLTTITVTTLDGAAAGGAAAAGSFVTVAISTLDGAATGGAAATGTLSTIVVTVADGTASGGAAAQGTGVTVTIVSLDGSAVGGAQASGDLGTVTVSSFDGSASGGGSVAGNASGDLGTVTVVPFEGSALGESGATGGGGGHARSYRPARSRPAHLAADAVGLPWSPVGVVAFDGYAIGVVAAAPSPPVAEVRAKAPPRRARRIRRPGIASGGWKEIRCQPFAGSATGGAAAFGELPAVRVLAPEAVASGGGLARGLGATSSERVIVVRPGEVLEFVAEGVDVELVLHAA